MNSIRVVLLFAMALPSVSQAVEIRDADRVSLHPSEPTEITLTGSQLRSDDGKIADLWTSVDAKVEPLDLENKDRNRVRYRITPNRPIAGWLAVRAFTNDEISQPLMFTVDALPSSPLPANDNETIEIPAILDGHSRGLGEHSIAFQAKAGKQFVAEVIGARIGSEIDPVITLRDKDGREIAFADDHLVSGADPILTHTPTYDGIHYLDVRDVEYRGGMRMQVRLTHETATAIAFPSAVAVGETRNVKLTSAMGARQDDSIVHVSPSRDQGLSLLPVLGRHIPVWQTTLPVTVEDSAGASTPISIPALYCGRFSKAAEVDSLLFAAKVGELLTIRSEQFGSPAIVNVRLFLGDRQIGEHNWGLDPYGVLRHQVTKDAIYRLEIRETIARSGDPFVYSLSIRNDVSHAILKLQNPKERKPKDQPHRFAVTSGETFELHARVDRRGVKGPVKLHVSINGQSCEVSKDIPDGKDNVRLEVKAPVFFDSNAKRKSPFVAALEVYGTSIVDGRTLLVPLDITEHLKRDWREGILPAVVSAVAVVVAPEVKK